MRPKKTVLVIILWTACIVGVLADSWYVDNQASGTNSGLSWPNAWNSLSAIRWELVGPGDMVFISGGSTSKTYDEALVVGASGSVAGGYITIGVGQESGHNGTVIITGGPSYGVGMRGVSYVTLSGQVGTGSDCRMRIQDRDSRGIRQDSGSHHINYRYLEVADSGLDVDAELNGILITFDSVSAISGEIAYCEIHDSRQDAIGVSLIETTKVQQFGLFRIHHNRIYNFHDDGIAGGAGGVDVYNNYIGDRVDPLRGHPDAIQFYNSYYRIYNNVFHGICDRASGNSVVYFEPNGGGQANLAYQTNPSNYLVYNNLFFEDSTASTSIDAVEMGWSDATFVSVSDVYIVNNTFVGPFDSTITMGWSDATLSQPQVHDFYILNNVFWNSSYDSGSWNFPIPNSGGGAQVNIGGFGSGKSIIVDFNCYSGQGSSEVGWQGTYSTFKASTGAQSHEIVGDPKLSSNFAAIDKNSPVVDAGTDLSFLFGEDILGAVRPQGSAWDIGAYEYGSGGIPATVMPPTRLRMK